MSTALSTSPPSVVAALVGPGASGLPLGKLMRCCLPLPQGGLELRIAVADCPAKLADIVPLAQQIADRVAAMVRSGATERGAVVPCRRGCAACCRYAVPLSGPEAEHLTRKLYRLPEMQRYVVLRRFSLAARKILRRRPGMDRLDLHRLSSWYAGLDLPCPLLDGGECILYRHRPLACREFLATTPAPTDCTTPGSKVLPLPVSLAACLHELTRCLLQSDSDTVFLPLAPVWAEQAQAKSPTWRPALLVKQLVTILGEQLKKPSPARA